MEGLRGREVRLLDMPTDNPDLQQYSAGKSFSTLLTLGHTDAADRDVTVERVSVDGFLALRIAWGGETYLLAYRTDPDVGRLDPKTLGIPLRAAFQPGRRQRADWYDRRHPSRDRDVPDEFYYNLPQHGVMLLHW